MNDEFSPQLMELRRELDEGLPAGVTWQKETLFLKLKGLGAAKACRNKLKLMQSVAPILRRCLNDGEEVVHVSSGIVNRLWEQMFMGAWAALVNQTTLVLTDRRLLLIHMSGKKPQSYVNQIPLTAVKKVGGAFALKVELAVGAVTLTGVPGPSRKFFKERLAQTGGAPAGGLECLCPKCYTHHEGFTEHCSNCNADTKSPKVAALRSLVLPGLGDFYLGHHVMATMEIVGSLITWGVAVFLIIEGTETQEPILQGVGVGVILMANILDALLTRAQARKGMMAADGTLATAD